MYNQIEPMQSSVTNLDKYKGFNAVENYKTACLHNSKGFNRKEQLWNANEMQMKYNNQKEVIKYARCIIQHTLKD